MKRVHLKTKALRGFKTALLFFSLFSALLSVPPSLEAGRCKEMFSKLAEVADSGVHTSGQMLQGARRTVFAIPKGLYRAFLQSAQELTGIGVSHLRNHKWKERADALDANEMEIYRFGSGRFLILTNIKKEDGSREGKGFVLYPSRSPQSGSSNQLYQVTELDPQKRFHWNLFLSPLRRLPSFLRSNEALLHTAPVMRWNVLGFGRISGERRVLPSEDIAKLQEALENPTRHQYQRAFGFLGRTEQVAHYRGNNEHQDRQIQSVFGRNLKSWLSSLREAQKVEPLVAGDWMSPAEELQPNQVAVYRPNKDNTVILLNPLKDGEREPTAILMERKTSRNAQGKRQVEFDIRVHRTEDPLPDYEPGDSIPKGKRVDLPKQQIQALRDIAQKSHPELSALQEQLRLIDFSNRQPRKLYSRGGLIRQGLVVTGLAAALAFAPFFEAEDWDEQHYGLKDLMTKVDEAKERWAEIPEEHHEAFYYLQHFLEDPREQENSFEALDFWMKEIERFEDKMEDPEFLESFIARLKKEPLHFDPEAESFEQVKISGDVMKEWISQPDFNQFADSQGRMPVQVVLDLLMISNKRQTQYLDTQVLIPLELAETETESDVSWQRVVPYYREQQYREDNQTFREFLEFMDQR